MSQQFTKIFTDSKLPFLELRYSNSNKHYKEHLHDTFSIGVNTKGNSTYTNKENAYAFSKNMLAIVNPNTIHSCNPTQKEPNEYYMMYLDANWCHSIQKSINDQIEHFMPFEEDIIVNDKLYDSYFQLCQTLFSSATAMEKEYELIEFFTNLFSRHIHITTQNKQDDAFESIRQYLDTNHQENITLDDLSQQFKLNSFYIIRLFKANLNMTPHAYMLNIKINHAKQMLKNGHSIVETALACGFSDQSHFHRHFLKIVATTPKAYQNNF